MGARYPVFVFALLLTGCSEYALFKAPPPEPEELSTPMSNSFAPADPPEGPPSPWDNLQPADIPEEYLLVGWRPPEEANWMGMPNLDLVDITGQVVGEIPFPAVQSEQWGDLDGWHYELREIEPAGPGAALVEVWAASFPALVEPHTVWFFGADAVEQESELLLGVGYNSLLVAPTQRSISLDGDIDEVYAALDPQDPEMLYVLAVDQYADGGPHAAGTLIAVDLTLELGEYASWTVEELAAADGFDQAPEFVWGLHAIVDDGETVLLIGSSVLSEGGGPGYENALFAFSPDSGPLEWTMSLPETPGVVSFGRHLLAAADGLDSVGVLVQPLAGWSGECTGRSADVVLYTEGAGRQDIGPFDDALPGCTDAGVLLDPAEPTWIYSTDAEELLGRDKIVVSHRGEPVWTIDHLRVGLTEQEFVVSRMARVTVGSFDGAP